MSERISPRTVVLISADSVVIYAAILVALGLRLGMDGSLDQLNDKHGWLKIALATLIFLIVLYFHDLYDYAVNNNRSHLISRLIQALGFTWAALAIFFYLAPFFELGRGTSAYAVVISLGFLLLTRTAIHFMFGHPEIGERVLIIGDGPFVIDTAKAVVNRRDAGFRIVGFIAPEFVGIERVVPQARNLGSMDDLERTVHKEKINRVVIGLREMRGAFPADALLRLRLGGEVAIEECPSFYERVCERIHLDMLRPSWLIFSQGSRDTELKIFSRNMIHRSLALLGLMGSFPIAILTAILIKLESKGPIFYRQQRVGKNGRTFELVKFRSMKVDAEANGDPVWAAQNDDRATRVGRVIRKIRVDEIPQFWNILKGEMNFVGPRPERPHFVSSLAVSIPYYEHRHLVAPGLTGWAQIKYPYGASVEDARQKLQYDLYYIKNQTLVMDLMIVLETVKIILFGRGGR